MSGFVRVKLAFFSGTSRAIEFADSVSANFDDAVLRAISAIDHRSLPSVSTAMAYDLACLARCGGCGPAAVGEAAT